MRPTISVWHGGVRPRRDDEERLLHFVATVDRCISRRAVQERTLRARFSIRSTIGEPVDVEADHGDEEDVRSLMLEFRKLLAKDNDAHFFGTATWSNGASTTRRC